MTFGRNQSGTASIEFLIAFIPFFLMCLGTIQLALIAVGHIVVKHAAVMATRAAVLVIDDDPYFDSSEGTKRGHMSTQVSGSKVDSTPLGIADLPKVPHAGTVSEGSKKGGACDRLSRVRRAAYVPLSVLAPSYFEQLWLGAGPNVESSFGSVPMLRVATGLLLYNKLASAITFPTEPGGDELHDLTSEGEPFADGDVITTRVNYLFACGVPIARDLICRIVPDMDEKDTAEFEHAEWHNALLFDVAGSLDRFVVIQAEASLPHQAAPYKYASELCKTKKKLKHCEGEKP